MRLGHVRLMCAVGARAVGARGWGARLGHVRFGSCLLRARRVGGCDLALRLPGGAGVSTGDAASRSKQPEGHQLWGAFCHLDGEGV